MKVFISWSKDRSREVAVALREWLPKVIPGVRAWMSEQDIIKGEEWFLALHSELRSSQLCLVLLTSENQLSPWLHFEAGAVFITGPKAILPIACEPLQGNASDSLFARFQTTHPTRSDFTKLVLLINERNPNPHHTELVMVAFDKYWDELNAVFLRFSKRTAVLASKPELSSASLLPSAIRLLSELKSNRINEFITYNSENGLIVMVNNTNIVQVGQESLMLEAISQLKELNIIEAVGFDDDLFQLTAIGREYASRS